jgi:hypothetical protein
MSSTTLEHRPFSVAVPQADLDDLRERLERTRFAPAAPGDSWDYGTPESYLRDMVGRWTAFDWRAVEDRVNAYPGFRTEIDGQPIHYLHVRSQHEDATPLLLAHSYPGSFLDFLDMIDPLVDPVAHGGRPEDAFHLVIPSMPGFGFSTPVVGDTDWNHWRWPSAANSFSPKPSISPGAPDGKEKSWSTWAPRKPSGSRIASSRETIAPPSLPWIP